MKRRRFILFTAPVILILGIYFLGSQPAKPVYSLVLPKVPASADELQAFVKSREALHRVRPDNEAEIVWADSTRSKTPYAIVYLHGFSASKMEGDPVHRELAKKYSWNLYLSRLSDHGIDTTENLLLFTPDRVWETAKEALAIGLQLGEKVILVSTSTGGTLALKLAAEYPDKVSILINLSPNIAINDPAAFLLNDPWGLEIARQVLGGNYRESKPNPVTDPYWYSKYRIEAIVQLEELVETTMTKEAFSRVHQPSLTLYYYKSETEQDPQVKVAAMLDMNAALGTPADKKVILPIPGAGEHVLGSSKVSKDIPAVQKAIYEFIDKVR